MNRFFSLVGSVLFTAVLLLGISVPTQSAQAGNACGFSCAVTFGDRQQECDTRSNQTVVSCPDQCRRLCSSIGMTVSNTTPSTCQLSQTDRARCSPCACIPTTAIACSGGASGVCGGQCTTICSAAAGRVTELQGGGSRIACATTPSPQCVAVSQPAAIRLCTACIGRCTADRFGDPADHTQLACHRSCSTAGGTTPDQVACVGVTAVEAGIAQGGTAPTAPTSAPAPSTPGSSGSPQTTNAPTPSSNTPTPPRTTEGVCQFNCKPQAPPPSCTTDAECTTSCQQVCGRSFRNGQCVTSGSAAASCRAVGPGGAKQCIFECSIGPSAQERSCNPQGTDAQAPVRVCNGFCQTACQAASTQPTSNSTPFQFCTGAPPTCLAPGAAAGGSESSNAPGSSLNRDGTATLGTANGGARLVNPLPGIDSLASLVGRLIKGILGIVGSVALLMFIYGGIQWILSAGDAKKVTAAQNILRNATIGMLLIFFSYSISNVILGLLSEIGTGTETTSSASAPAQTGTLATCVEYAVTHGFIGRNEARDTTNASWACRQTSATERADRTRCITRGCPNDPANVLCCAPVGSTPTTAPGTTPAAAPIGCRTTVAAAFHLRPTATSESTGDQIAAGAKVQVLAAGTVVRGQTLIHQIRIIRTVGDTAGPIGWMFLTPTEVSRCTIPAS